MDSSMNKNSNGPVLLTSPAPVGVGSSTHSHDSFEQLLDIDIEDPSSPNSCSCPGHSSSSAPAETTVYAEGSILDCQKEIEKCRWKIKELNKILNNVMNVLVTHDAELSPTGERNGWGFFCDSNEELLGESGEDLFTNKDEKLVCEGIGDKECLEVSGLSPSPSAKVVTKVGAKRG